MKTSVLAACVTLLCLAAASVAAEEKGRPAHQVAGESPESVAGSSAEVPASEITWYAQALAQGPGGLNVTQFWSKGSKLRAETVIAGHKVVTIVAGEWYCAYDAALGEGIRVRRAPEALAKDVPYRRPFGNDALKLIQQGAELVRQEDFHGRDADVYQLTDVLGRRTVWVSKDALNIPLRIEIYNRSHQTRQSTDYTDWLTGLRLRDAFFEIPPGTHFEEYDIEGYARAIADEGSVGPVPVLYMDLLRGR